MTNYYIHDFNQNQARPFRAFMPQCWKYDTDFYMIIQQTFFYKYTCYT